MTLSLATPFSVERISNESVYGQPYLYRVRLMTPLLPPQTMECIVYEVIKKINQLLAPYVEIRLLWILVTFQLPFLFFSVFCCFSSIRRNCRLAHRTYIFVHPCVPVSSECCHGCVSSPAVGCVMFSWTFISLGIKEVCKFLYCGTLMTVYGLLHSRNILSPADAVTQRMFQTHPVDYCYHWWECPPFISGSWHC